MSRANRSEVPMIQRIQAAHAEPLGDGDDRGVDDTETGIRASVEDLDGAMEVRIGQGLEAPVRGREMAGEVGLRAWAQPGSDEVADLRQRGLGHDDRLGLAPQRVTGAGVSRVGGVDQGIEHAGIDNDCHGSAGVEVRGQLDLENLLRAVRHISRPVSDADELRQLARL